MFLTDYNETCSTAELLKEILQAGIEPATTCLKGNFLGAVRSLDGHRVSMMMSRNTPKLSASSSSRAAICAIRVCGPGQPLSGE